METQADNKLNSALTFWGLLGLGFLVLGTLNLSLLSRVFTTDGPTFGHSICITDWDLKFPPKSTVQESYGCGPRHLGTAGSCCNVKRLAIPVLQACLSALHRGTGTFRNQGPMEGSHTAGTMPLTARQNPSPSTVPVLCTPASMK